MSFERLNTAARQKDFLIYLDFMEQGSETVSSRTVCFSRVLWDLIRQELPDLDPPMAGPSVESPGGLEFTWDNRKDHLDIDIIPDEIVYCVDWFYRNHETGEFEGNSFSIIADDAINAPALLDKLVKDLMPKLTILCKTRKARNE